MTKATRTQVQIGSLAVDGFMLPDGSYRISEVSTADAVGKSQEDLERYLDAIEVEPESVEDVPVVSLSNAMYFWQFEAARGNSQAQKLIQGLFSAALTERIEKSFGPE